MVKENHRAPQLTAVLVGDDPASRTYVNNKMKVKLLVNHRLAIIFLSAFFLKAAEFIGITSVTKNLPKSTTENELMEIIAQLNDDNAVDGILVQLPLPDHINERKVRKENFLNSVASQIFSF